MELVITVLTLIAAVLAVTPRERLLDIRVRVREFDWLTLSLAFVTVLALEFYDFLQPHYSWMLPKESWWKGITPKNAMYLVLLVEAAILSLRLRWAKLTPGKMRTFRDLVEELYWNESYSELFALLQTHLKSLFRIYSANYFLPRLRAQLDPLRYISLSAVNELTASLGMPAPIRSTPTYFQRVSRRISSPVKYWGWRVIRLFPANDQPQSYAQEIVRGIFLNPKFLTALAQTRPYLGLEIIVLSKNSFERNDFVNLFVKELLRDPHSALFIEIENNQNNIANNRYDIIPSNRLLHFFLSDVRVAKEVGIYKPIGDFVISYLDGFTRNPQDDPYNWSNDNDFEQTGIWRSPLFLCIRFFDIMVKEALFQNMFWHMWLYYMPLICERMVRNFRLHDDPLVETEYEFPTRYGHLLYEMFSSMRSWILAVFDLPQDQTNVILKSTSPALHENGNIPKSTIIALAECLRIVLTSVDISDRTKRSLTNMVFDIYFDLRSRQFDSYAAVLLSAISEGKSYRRNNDQYKEVLARMFGEEKREYLITRNTKHVNYVESVLK